MAKSSAATRVAQAMHQGRQMSGNPRLTATAAQIRAGENTRPTAGHAGAATQAVATANRAAAAGNTGGNQGGTWQTTTTPAPAVTPFLTPAQQKSLSDWNTKYGDELAKYNDADSNALTKFTDSYSADQFKNANTQDLDYQSMAARGLGQSSIRQNALNDLATTLAQQYNVLDAAYKTTLTNDALNRDMAEGTNDTTQSYYSSLGVQNAQAIAPNTTPTTTSTFVPATANTGSPTPTATQPANTTGSFNVGTNGLHPASANVNTNPAATQRAASVRSAPKVSLNKPTPATGGAIGRAQSAGGLRI